MKYINQSWRTLNLLSSENAFKLIFLSVKQHKAKHVYQKSIQVSETNFVWRHNPAVKVISDKV